MGFLAPLWLLAGAAAAVPLLIHLMRRRAGARIEFPAVRYLVRAEREHSRDLRLRNLLLMILRVAAVLLITLAAARPIIRIAGAGHAPTALAIVLDNSLSTSAVVGGRPVLQGLEARARDIIRRSSSSDRLWLVTADGVVHGGSRSAVLDAAAHTEPFGGAGDLRAATSRAVLLARAAALTDANGALFDVRHAFAGCIAGLHEILRRQRLLAGNWCLDPNESLSPGQLDEIDRVVRAYPELTDDAFVAANIDEWLR